MDFGDFLRGIESNIPVQEQTKQDLLDIVIAKSAQAMKEKGYPCMDLAFPDGREGEIDVTYWGNEGSPYDGRVCGEIVLIIPEPRSSHDTLRLTCYSIFRTPEGLGLSKYVDTEERNLPEISLPEISPEVAEYMDGLSANEIQHGLDEEREQSRTSIERHHDKNAVADEMGISLVFEPEAVGVLGLIRNAKPNDNPRF